MTPEETDKVIEDLLKRQHEFEKVVFKKLDTFMETISETVETSRNHSGAKDFFDRTERAASNNEFQQTQTIPTTGFQLPISFRYRNDTATGGASGTHRLEYILSGTPYSSGTTEWPDADWTAIPGADAEIYVP